MLIDAQSFRCNSTLLLLALDILKQHNISFIDAYAVASTQINSDNKIVSFDEDYDKIKGVKRVEP